MLAGMTQALMLGVEHRLLPGRPAATPDRRERGIEVDQYVGFRALPQVGHVRVLLRNGASIVPGGFQVGYEGRLARRADAHDNHTGRRGVCGRCGVLLWARPRREHGRGWIEDARPAGVT